MAFRDIRGGQVIAGGINAHKWYEDVVCGGTVTAGDICKVVGVVGNFLQIARADADDASDIQGQLYIALARGTSGSHVPAIRTGVVTMVTTGQAVGDPVYMSSTAGGISLTPTGIGRKIGHVIKVGGAGVGKVLISAGAPAVQGMKVGTAAVAGAVNVTVTAATLGGNFDGRPVLATTNTGTTINVISAVWSGNDLVITFSASFTGTVSYFVGLL